VDRQTQTDDELIKSALAAAATETYASCGHHEDGKQMMTDRALPSSHYADGRHTRHVTVTSLT